MFIAKRMLKKELCTTLNGSFSKMTNNNPRHNIFMKFKSACILHRKNHVYNREILLFNIRD